MSVLKPKTKKALLLLKKFTGSLIPAIARIRIEGGVASSIGGEAPWFVWGSYESEDFFGYPDGLYTYSKGALEKSDVEFSPEDIPEAFAPEGKFYEVATVTGEQLKFLQNAVSSGTGSVLNNVMIEKMDEGRVAMVSTDGSVLNRLIVSGDFPDTGKKDQLLIHLETLKGIPKNANRVTIEAAIEPGKKPKDESVVYVRLNVDGVILAYRPESGPYPNYRQLIPRYDRPALWHADFEPMDDEDERQKREGVPVPKRILVFTKTNEQVPDFDVDDVPVLSLCMPISFPSNGVKLRISSLRKINWRGERLIWCFDKRMSPLMLIPKREGE